jgi:surfeit locus 1 family protein
MPVTRFQNVETSGRYDGQRQVLIDNMFLDGRNGYYVLTAFRYAAGQPLLIVNRGWVARPAAGRPEPDISVGNAERTIRGRVGNLPRVGIRSGGPFEGGAGWPKKAFYPTLDDLSAELGEELLPFILLLGPEDADGYIRHWQPRDSGPMMHYGYAFQWFAMAAAVFGMLLWQLRKRAQKGRSR